MTVVQDNLQLLAQVLLALMACGAFWLLGAPLRVRPAIAGLGAVATYGVALPAVVTVVALVYGAAWLVRRAGTGHPRGAARRWRLSQVAVVGLMVAFVALRVSAVGTMSRTATRDTRAGWSSAIR